MKSSCMMIVSSLAALLACGGCTDMANPFHPTPYIHPGAQAQRQVPQQNATAGAVAPANYASAGSDCSTRAQDRMKMYDRPDTYPISDKERKDAYSSLYSACMQEHNWQVAGASHNNVAPSEASQLAALMPAAGGSAPRSNTVNANGTLITTSAAPGGGTVIVVGGSSGGATAAQLSSLSPAAGGSAAPQNATVVLVQSPQAQAVVPAQAAYIPAIPTAPLPVAVPIAPPPMAKGYASPAQPASAPVSAPVRPQAAYAPPRPSLAGADAAATGNGPAVTAANAQIENVLEK